MSKRNSEGDVIYNRVAVGEAGFGQLLGSMLGPRPEPGLDTKRPSDGKDDEDLDNDNDEIFGVGAIIPKHIEDGSFTRRLPGSDDKLLQQLIGKKRAQAHLDAQKASSRSNIKQQKYSKPTPAPKEESEAEEEGRASAFKSKKRKTQKSKSKIAISEEASGVDEEPRDASVSELPVRIASEDGDSDEAEEVSAAQRHGRDDCVDAEESKGPSAKSGSQKSKPTSYLDELLAERSKKKKKKKKSKGKTDA